MKGGLKLLGVLLVVFVYLTFISDVAPGFRFRFRFVKRVTRAVSSGVRKVGQGISSGVRKAGNGINTGIRKAGQGINTGIRKTGQGINTGIRKTGQGIKTGVRKTGEGLKKAGEGLKKASEVTYKGLKETGKALITSSNFVSDILDKINLVKFIWKKLGACCIPFPSLCSAKREYESIQKQLKYYNQAIDNKWKNVENLFVWINKINENTEDIAYNVERITTGTDDIISTLRPPLMIQYNNKMNVIKQDIKWKNSSVVHLTRQGVTNFVVIEMAWKCKQVADSVKSGLSELKEAKSKCVNIMRESDGLLKFFMKGWSEIKDSLASHKLKVHLNQVKSLCTDLHRSNCVSAINEFIAKISSADYGKTFELQEDLIRTLTTVKYSFSCFKRKEEVIATVAEYCRKGNENYHSVFLQAVVDFFPNHDICTGIVTKDYTTKGNVLKVLQMTAEKNGFYSSCSLNNKEIITKTCLNYTTLAPKYQLTSSEKSRLFQDCKKIVPNLGKVLCRSDLCKNGGICLERETSYSCKCLKGFVGRHCEIKFDCKNPKFLGMENHQILDSQITASSEWNKAHGSTNGRLNFQAHGGRTGAWSSRNNDLNQWLQVDFQQQAVVIGISTQGRGNCGCNQWVKSYIISYSGDGINFQDYKQGGLIKVFPGNSNKNSIAHNVLSPVITARFLRIKPKSWNGHISMRVDFNGCYKGCQNPKFLGMENNQILDSQITASSEWNKAHGPTNGRLNFQAHGGRTGAWSSRNNDLNQWLQVDFQQQAVVIGISTQGRGNCGCNQWVKSYIVSYSDDGINFQDYKQGGLIKVFPGNSNKNSIVHNVLSPVITARFLRIKPKSWNGHISMRVDFNGCYKGCQNPKFLGMENNQILDSQITASSEWNRNHGPTNGRLNFQAHGGRTGAWSSRNNDLNQWLQVDFQQQAVVIGISTQGRGNCGCNQWVKSYIISYSDDGSHFKDYKQGGLVKVFQGNSDKNTIIHHSFVPSIVARFIRVHPKTWNEHISMRMDFNGCISY